MRFKYLPQALQVMCAGLVLGPVGAALTLAPRWSAIVSLPVWYLVYLGVTYVVLPWLLAALVMKRHALFLYSFGVECCLLFAHTFIIGRGEMPAYFRTPHYAFAMIASALALMLINRDILFPFIFETYRGFRRAPRMELNQRVTVSMARINKTFEAMVEDASLSGLAVYGFEDAMSDVLAFAQRGEPLVMTYRSAKQTLQVQGWFLWSMHKSSIVKIGFRASDPQAMEAFFDVLGLGSRRAGWRRKLQTQWSKRGVRRALNYGLAVLILGALMLPLLGRGAVTVAPVPERPEVIAPKKSLKSKIGH